MLLTICALPCILFHFCYVPDNNIKHIIHFSLIYKDGADFTPFDDERLTFTPGLDRLCRPLMIRQDGSVESVETVDLTISSDDLEVRTPSMITIFIEDSDREFKLYSLLDPFLLMCVLPNATLYDLRIVQGIGKESMGMTVECIIM